MENNHWPLMRVIVPAFPEVNIYTAASKKTTDLGSIMVASAANMLWGWRVEVINENNYRGPRNKEGLPDHKVLQEENPASIIGFCCGLTSTIERVWKLAEFYKALGVATVAGGWHAHYCPEETLLHHIDLVVHGDGEKVIRKILENLSAKLPLWENVPGTSFMCQGKVVHHTAELREVSQIPDTDEGLIKLKNELSDLDDLPLPNFSLLKYAKLVIYPIGRTRGCKYNCEFCSVKGAARSASANHLFQTVNWLVETRGARKFFIVDDRLEEDLEGTIEFFRLISQKYGSRLYFLAQVRLESAKNARFVKAMVDAGVKTLCIGYESPSDDDLKSMRKGITSIDMLNWTRIFGKFFWIHAMFIFGYPSEKGKVSADSKKMVNAFKCFIKEARKAARRGFSIQIMKAVAIVGTDLRRRLQKEGVLFPLEIFPWRYYDGNWACFMPKTMTLREFQEAPIQIMNWFYSRFILFRICVKTIVFPLDYFVRGWHNWKMSWRKDVVRYAGSRLVRQWKKRNRSREFTDSLLAQWKNK